MFLTAWQTTDRPNMIDRVVEQVSGCMLTLSSHGIGKDGHDGPLQLLRTLQSLDLQFDLGTQLVWNWPHEFGIH